MITTLSCNLLKLTLNSANPLTAFSAGIETYFHDSSGDEYFQQGDNINVLSVGMSVPSFLGIIDATYSASIPYGIAFDIPGLDPVYFSNLPFAPYELSLGEFFDMSMVLSNYRIRPFLVGLPWGCTGSVSSVYDGIEIPLTCFIKIEHNLPLVVAP